MSSVSVPVSFARLCAAALGCALATGGASGAIVINGSIDSGDWLATDSTLKTFYYDIYEISNPTGDPILVDIGVVGAHAESAGHPWITYWTAPVLPSSDWESPVDLYTLAAFINSAGQSVSFPTFALPAGETYQMAVSTTFYLEDGAFLEAYTLTVEGEGLRVVEVLVPAPGVGAVAPAALLALARRRRR